MDTMKSITPKEMREINRTCVLEYLRQHGAVSRSAIAGDLGLSLSSVVRITDELMENRLIHLQGEYEFSGGRRRPLIELDTAQNVVVSIALGGTEAKACLLDIMGKTIETRSVRDHGCRGDACVALIKSLADELLAHVGGRTLRGISVGVPGIVIDGNRVKAAPSVGLDNYLLADCLSPHYNCPVFVENDVNLSAIGELWFGYGKQCDSLIYIHIGTLIGMGIILDRCMLRGAHTGAGELGYLMLNAAQLPSSFQNYGALEESISGLGLAKRAREALAEQGMAGARITAKELFARAQGGEAWAKAIVGDFVDKLAMVLVNVATLFDPEQIVLGGGVMESAHVYLPAIHALIKDKTPNPIYIEWTRLGRQVKILGGCASVLQHAMRYTKINDMI